MFAYSRAGMPTARAGVAGYKRPAVVAYLKVRCAPAPGQRTGSAAFRYNNPAGAMLCYATWGAADIPERA
jgi:hypothetical protein